MSNEWDANIQAISDSLDRKDREIAIHVEALNAANRRIAVLDHLLKEVSDNLDASEKELREAQAALKQVHANYGLPA